MTRQLLRQCLCFILIAQILGQGANQNAYLQSGFDSTNLVEMRLPYSHDGVEFEGYFAYDSSCPMPLTLLLINHDWDGGNDYEEWQAKRYANECFAAFVVDLYGADVPKGDDLSFERRIQFLQSLYGDLDRVKGIVSAAIEAVSSQEVVDTSTFVTLGYCSGGTFSMEYVRLGFPVLGAIGLHVGNPNAVGNATFSDATLPNARVVILNGADDTSVDEGAYDQWVQEADEAGLTWEYTLYGNTVHSYTEPSLAPEFLFDPDSNSRYNPYAAERAFSQTLELMRDFTDSSRNEYLSDPWNDTMVDLSILTQVQVDYTDVYDGASLRGIAVYDNTFCGQRPVVLIVSDWDGIGDYEIWRARLLAHQGYFAFIVDVYGTQIQQPIPDFETRIQQTGFYMGVPERVRARLLAALTEVYSEKHSSLVLPNSAVIIGYCFGGSSVLEFARDDPEGLVGVVSFHASNLDTTASKVQSGNDVKILVLNGGDDSQVDPEEIDGFFEEFGAAKVEFEFTNFAATPHGWTVPTSSSYVALSDWRSWTSFLDFLKNVSDGRDPNKCS